VALGAVRQIETSSDCEGARRGAIEAFLSYPVPSPYSSLHSAPLARVSDGGGGGGGVGDGGGGRGIVGGRPHA
jgi:hypothetical protein